MRVFLIVLCDFLLAACCAGAQPVRPLPAPTGPFIVGTSVAYANDGLRSSAEFPRGRPVTIQLWYPAQRASTQVAPYLIEQGLDSALLADSYYGIDSATARMWRTLETHASIDAPVRSGRFPLLAFSVGLGVIRANYTSLATELASHGYVVMLVESPLQGYMRLPDGRVITDTAGLSGTPAGHRNGVISWSRDISWATDTLHAPRTGILRDIARAIDWKRLAAAGHSSGGIVALATCERDRRFRACIDLDGGLAGPAGEPMADFETRGFTKPALILRSQPLYDDTTFARRGITRAQWEAGALRARLVFDSVVQRSALRPTIAFVAGTGHFSFSDAPFVLPSTITRFGGRIIEPRRGWAIITHLMLAYLDQELSDHRGRFAAVARAYPEVTVR